MAAILLKLIEREKEKNMRRKVPDTELISKEVAKKYRNLSSDVDRLEREAHKKLLSKRGER